MIRRRMAASGVVPGVLVALATPLAGPAPTAAAVPPPPAPQEASAVAPGGARDRAPDSVPTADGPAGTPPMDSVPAGPGPGGAALDQLTARVAAQLRCPVCRNQSVLESSATLSQEMQREIRRRLASGDSPAEVKRYFVSRYGEWILLQPRAEGVNLLVYVLPALVLLGGLIFAWRQIRAWSGAGGEPAGDAAAGPAGTAGPAADRRSGSPAGAGDAGTGGAGALSREEEERVDELVREGGG